MATLGRVPPQHRARRRVVPGALPDADATELDWITFEQSGVLTTAQALDAIGEGRLRGMLRSGQWRPACRGVVVTTNARLSRDQHLWVAVLAAGTGAVLAGATAAAEAGVRGLPGEPIHVLIPATRHTTTARAVVDSAAWARGDDEARATLAAACQQRRVTPEEVEKVLDLLPKVHRRALTIETPAGHRRRRGGALRDRLRPALPETRPTTPELQERRSDAGWAPTD
jgi:hypothetical protein